MTPLLSVLIDTYNHENYIEQAVVSAIEQDLPASDYEIVVVDDGSTDRTAEIVRKFAPRVQLLTKKNGGQASAFNAAFPELRGEIVSFLDGDDWFATGKLVAVMDALGRHPEVAAVGHGYYEFHGGKQEVRVHSPGEQKFFDLATREHARDAYFGWRFLLMGALTARREALKPVMPVSQRLTFCADSPIALGCLATRVCVLPQPLFYYRHHSDNLHSGDPRSETAMRRRFEMKELMYEDLEPLLLRLGVREDSIRAFLYPPWVADARRGLREFGGSRLKVLRTEMRAFRLECQRPAVSYRLFKYGVVGLTTLLLPPRAFYRLRDWYGRRNLGRLRERLASSR